MKNVLDKLMMRSNDYVAAIDVEDDHVLADIRSTAKAMVCVGKAGSVGFEGLKDIKVFKSIKQVDESVFNKVLVTYSDELNLKNVVRIAENLGMVLICGVPGDKKEVFENLLARKAGIYEVWDFESDKKDNVDFLFKVRKY
jgi:hypothetical protein